jgi:hypothetical protein
LVYVFYQLWYIVLKKSGIPDQRHFSRKKNGGKEKWMKFVLPNCGRQQNQAA